MCGATSQQEDCVQTAHSKKYVRIISEHELHEWQAAAIRVIREIRVRLI